MKSYFLFGLALALGFTARAQVTVQVGLDQEQFLPSESLVAIVRITNRSGQPLHLGVDDGWLTFTVESADGYVVARSTNPPVAGEFDLGSAQVATKRVDLAPYFGLSRVGHYQVIATAHLQAWNQDVASPPKGFDVINGAKIWSQVFGLPAPAGVTNQEPEVRKYTLEEANYLREQLRMYVQVSDESEMRVFKVRAIGPMVAFGQPEAQLDGISQLHVLNQSSGSVFTYSVVNPHGDILRQDFYDYVSNGPRPRLRADESGHVSVYGGVRRVRPEELPLVIPPNQAVPAKP